MNARDIIGAARIRVVNKAPYFACAVFKLRPVEKKGFGTLAVDAGGRLWYDPDKVERWGTQAVSGVLYHEINHLLRRHHDRCGSRNPMTWNAATDVAINDTVVNAGFVLPTENGKQIGIMPKDFGFPNGLTEEEYYSKLQEKSESKQSDQDQDSGEDDQSQSRPAPGHGKCGGCTANPWPEEETGKDNHTDSTKLDGVDVPPPLSEGELEVMRKKTAEDIRAHAKKRGTIPGALRDWAEEELEPPKIDYRRAFAKMVRASVTKAAGRVDYTFSRLGRSYAARRHVLGKRTPISPSMHRPTPNVAIVADTSGSMGSGKNSPLCMLMSEVVGIVKAIGSPLKVFATDSAVGATLNVFKKSDVSKIAGYGGGGTDMPVGIKAADEDKSRPNVIVCITDGYTNYPSVEEMPRADLVVVLIGSNPPDVPDHIKNVLRVTVEDLKEA